MVLPGEGAGRARPDLTGDYETAGDVLGASLEFATITPVFSGNANPAALAPGDCYTHGDACKSAERVTVSDVDPTIRDVLDRIDDLARDVATKDDVEELGRAMDKRFDVLDAGFNAVFDHVTGGSDE